MRREISLSEKSKGEENEELHKCYNMCKMQRKMKAGTGHEGELDVAQGQLAVTITAFIARC